VVNSARSVRPFVFRAKVDWHRASVGPPNCKHLSYPFRDLATWSSCRQTPRGEATHRHGEAESQGGASCMQKAAQFASRNAFFSRDLHKSFSCDGFIRAVNSAHGVRPFVFRANVDNPIGIEHVFLLHLGRVSKGRFHSI